MYIRMLTFLLFLFLTTYSYAETFLVSSHSSGAYYSMAIKADGTLWAWGHGGYGNLGDNSFVNHAPTAKQIGSSSDWTKVTATSEHTRAVNSSGELWAWGRNQYGQLGIGSDTEYFTTPQKAGSDTDWKDVFKGMYTSYAIKTNDKLYAWGLNDHGQMGNDSTTNSNVPVKIGDDTWLMVSGGANFTTGIKADGTLWAWGVNQADYYQLGDGTTTERHVPTSIGSGTWKKVSSNNWVSLAIKSNDTLWAWGYNGQGQYGNGGTTTSTTPVQIGSATWSDVAAGYLHCIGIKTDGTLWGWGYNGFGQVGDGTTTNRLSPVQIGSASNWTSVKAGAYFSTAINSSGQVYAWGNNYRETVTADVRYQLGQGTVDVTNSSTPLLLSQWVTYYVNASTGNNSRTKTQAQSAETPWLTIQKCADNATSGDTCTVAAGTYTEQIETKANGTDRNYVKFYASGEVIVNGSTAGFIIKHEYIKIYGDSLANSFIVTGTTSGTYGAFLLYDGSGHCLIDTVTVHGTVGDIAAFKIGGNVASNYNTIQNCDIYDIHYIAFFNISGSSYTNILNNVFRDSSTGQLDFVNGNGDYLTIRGNTQYNLSGTSHSDVFQAQGPTSTQGWLIEDHLAYNLTDISLGQIEGPDDAIKNWTIRNSVFCDFQTAYLLGNGFAFYNNVFCNMKGTGQDNVFKPVSTHKNWTNNVKIKNNVFFGTGNTDSNGWYNIGYNAPNVWTQNTGVTEGTQIYSTSPNGYHIYRAMNNGTTGGTEPNWDATGIVNRTCSFVTDDKTVTCSTTSDLRTHMGAISSAISLNRDVISTINDGTTWELYEYGATTTGDVAVKFSRQPDFINNDLNLGSKLNKTGTYVGGNTYVTVTDATGIAENMVVRGCYLSVGTTGNYRYVTSIAGNQINLSGTSGSGTTCTDATFTFWDDVVVDNDVRWLILMGSYGLDADYNYVAKTDYSAKTGFPPSGFDTHGINSGNAYFTTPASYDFMISNASSVLIGKGVVIESFTDDKNGVVRGVSWDIGPYEYTNGGSPYTLPLGITLKSSGGGTLKLGN